MEEILNNKLSELIDIFEKDKRIIELKKLKIKIYNDTKLMNLLNKYNNFEQYNVALKKEIFQHKTVVEYKKLENEINYIILKMNKELNSLIDRKVCQNENN